MIRLLSTIVLATVASIGASQCFAQASAKKGAEEHSWPQFLGPSRNGISAETGLLNEWPASGPKEVWRAAGGIGMSGLAIADGQLVTLVQRDGKQWLIALDAKTGKPRWETPLAPEYKNAMGDGPRGTPTIAPGKILAFTGEGILAAVNAADGKPLWLVNLPEKLGVEPAEYGMACSPLVVGDQVIVTVGPPGATIAACDIASGRILWSNGDDPAGYSSPALLELHGKKLIVAFTGASLLAIDPETGKLAWRYPFQTNYECNIVTPLVHENQIFISAGENHGSVLLAPSLDGDQWSLKEVWTSLGTQSVLRNEWQTSMLLDGYLYGLDNVGAAGPVTHLTCVEVATGNRMWQKLRFGKGNLIAADGKLFISTMQGELVVVRATPKEYTEIGRIEVLGPMRQAPALAGGLLYLRDNKEILCLNVRQ